MMGVLATATCALAATMIKPAIAHDQKPIADYKCTHPSYQVHMVSKSPLVVYLAGFVTLAERKHLLDMA